MDNNITWVVLTEAASDLFDVEGGIWLRVLAYGPPMENGWVTWTLGVSLPGDGEYEPISSEFTWHDFAKVRSALPPVEEPRP